MAIEVFDMISGLVKSQLFTVSGTWTKPTSLKGDYIKIRICGGGGGGAGSGITDEGEGGEAGHFIEQIIQVTGNLTVTIGAGGAVLANGSNSSVSSGASLTALGGQAGRITSTSSSYSNFNISFGDYGKGGRGRVSTALAAEAGNDGACEIIWSE